MQVFHLAGVVFFDDVDGFLAEQLGGIGSFVRGGDLLAVPQVQRTASHVQGSDFKAAGMTVVVLTAQQVA